MGTGYCKILKEIGLDIGDLPMINILFAVVGVVIVVLAIFGMVVLLVADK